MAALNEMLRFEDLPVGDRGAFRGKPERVLIAAGQRLFRFATDGENGPLGVWWIRPNTYEILALRAGRLGTSVQALARSKLAIQEDWSSRMNRLYIGTIIDHVYGFEGTASHQPMRGQDRAVLLAGNLAQVWVGNLSATHVRLAACDL